MLFDRSHPRMGSSQESRPRPEEAVVVFFTIIFSLIFRFQIVEPFPKLYIWIFSVCGGSIDDL